MKASGIPLRTITTCFPHVPGTGDALTRQTPGHGITAIKNGCYDTSPTYVSTIMGIIKKYNLTRFDSVVLGCGETSKETVIKGAMPTDRNPFKKPTRSITLGTNGEGAEWVEWWSYRFGMFCQKSLILICY